MLGARHLCLSLLSGQTRTLSRTNRTAHAFLHPVAGFRATFYLRSCSAGEDWAPSLTEWGVRGGSGKGLEHQNRPDTCSRDAGTWPWGSEVKGRRETVLG